MYCSYYLKNGVSDRHYELKQNRSQQNRYENPRPQSYIP